jgi:hypothetical protein
MPYCFVLQAMCDTFGVVVHVITSTDQVHAPFAIPLSFVFHVRFIGVRVKDSLSQVNEGHGRAALRIMTLKNLMSHGRCFSATQNWHLEYQPEQQGINKKVFISYISPVHYNSLVLSSKPPKPLPAKKRKYSVAFGQ